MKKFASAPTVADQGVSENEAEMDIRDAIHRRLEAGAAKAEKLRSRQSELQGKQIAISGELSSIERERAALTRALEALRDDASET